MPRGSWIARVTTRQLQQLLQVPGDGLPLPVRVGGEVDGVAALCRVLELMHQGLLTLDLDIVWLKIVLDVHTQRALGKIAQMAHAGLHLVVVS